MTAVHACGADQVRLHVGAGGGHGRQQHKNSNDTVTTATAAQAAATVDCGQERDATSANPSVQLNAATCEVVIIGDSSSRSRQWLVVLSPASLRNKT